MRTFEFTDAGSNKFWSIEVVGTYYQVRFGKIGSKGQTQRKTFATNEAAQAEADKLVREKLKKGYTETTAGGTAAPLPAVASVSAATEDGGFWRALTDNPDDRAGWCAYADWLVEHGDPRGEFMQTQLALEDESRPKKERDALKKKEADLLKRYEKQWVGEWADHENARARTDEWRPPSDAWKPYTLTRGFVTAVELGNTGVELMRLVTKSPHLRFVRELVVHGIAYDDEYEDGPDTAGLSDGRVAQHVLLRWPQLRHLRAFRYGGSDPYLGDYDYVPNRCHTPGDLIADLVAQMPDVEEVAIMAHLREAERLLRLPLWSLRTLTLYHGWSYPLDVLAGNATLGNLRELHCHPHALEGGDDPYIRLEHLEAVCRSAYLPSLTHLRLHLADFGDDGVKEVIDSGLLRRLKVLDFRHGMITDDSARALAACPDLKRLEHLDLSWNRLTADGVAELARTGVPATLSRQQTDDEEVWETFGHGDIE